ncbi:MAG: 2-amino-4-hydroxy-6-hydroxymethyldihydropteridine diphosphokinase [Mariprofundaceae bacterium]|nr:2-amino-4-hydroxy-6-hydroxymethyldihydropteridine diphosphokinase [Mariprofundaceae bacterium]
MAVQLHGHSHVGVETIVAFGGNIGDVLTGFLSARERLGRTKGLQIFDSSCVYHSPPMGPAGQPDYLNAVMLLHADMAAETLLQHLQGIEKQHGRTRSGDHWEPRTLDLDLIAYNDTVMQTKHLTLPHPHMHKRMFVLQPLCDIRPNWRHPVLKQTARDLLKDLAATGVSCLEEGQAW